MKQVKNIDFPYPFLMDGNDNFKDSRFNIDCNFTKDKKIEMNISIDIVCPFIERLLKNKEAILAINIEQRTYRNTIKLLKVCDENGEFMNHIERTFELKNAIDELSPNYNIEVVAMIISIKDIFFKYNESMSPVFSYFDNDFKYNAGSIIGYSNFEEYEYPTDKKVSSIFTITKFTDPTIKDPYRITFSGDIIEIQVQECTRKNFREIRNQHPTQNKIYNSVFVYPAIEMAVYSMFTNYNLYKDLKWCRAVGNKIAAFEGLSIDTIIEDYKNQLIDADDIIKYTHVILEDLLVDAFNEGVGGEI